MALNTLKCNRLMPLPFKGLRQCSRVHQNTPFSFQKLPPPPSNPKYAAELDELDMWSTVMVMMMMMQVTSLYVEDPARTRIMQWTNITNADGM